MNRGSVWAGGTLATMRWDVSTSFEFRDVGFALTWNGESIGRRVVMVVRSGARGQSCETEHRRGRGDFHGRLSSR